MALQAVLTASFLSLGNPVPAVFADVQAPCKLADLTFDPKQEPLEQKCHAGWLVFEQTCYKAERTAHCPPETYHEVFEYARCSHEDFGPASFRDEQVAGGHYFPALLSHNVSEPAFRQQKQREAEEALAKLRASNPKYKHATVRLTADARPNGHVWYQRVIEHIVNEWNEGTGPCCPVVAVHNGAPKTYSVCRAEAHGEADPSECQFARKFAPQSTLNAARQAMPLAATNPSSALHAPICVSCEDVPLGDNPAEAKFDCLIGAMISMGAHVAMEPAQVVAAKNEVRKQLLLVHEFVGDQLPIDHQLYFRTLFDTVAEHDPACGTSYKHVDESPVDWAPLYACRRLLLSHVAKDTLRANNAYCQAAIARAAKGSPLLQESDREALRWLMNSLSSEVLQ